MHNMCTTKLFAPPTAMAVLRELQRPGIRYSVDEIISELNLALIECRGHMVARTDDVHALENLRAAVRQIQQALDLLKSYHSFDPGSGRSPPASVSESRRQRWRPLT